jgi:hypothetical protein
VLCCCDVPSRTQGQKLDPWQGVKLMSAPAAAALLLLTLATELRPMLEQGGFQIMAAHAPAFALAASLGNDLA